MSAHPEKFTSLRVTNVLNAKEIWTAGIYDRKGKKNLLVELRDYVEKMSEIKEIEVRMKDLLAKIESGEISTGASGAPVETPVSGKDGIQGPVGPVGPQGKQGIPGIRGKEGKIGSQGAIGPAGEGLRGPRGEPGEDGARGPRGNIGPDGDAGPRGPKGEPGPPCECNCKSKASAKKGTNSVAPAKLKLSDLLDINADGVEDGDVLVYDAESKSFVFASLG